MQKNKSKDVSENIGKNTDKNTDKNTNKNIIVKAKLDKDRKLKIITLYTLKNMLHSRVFWITNILMVFVVLFLSNTVNKLESATKNYMQNFESANIEVRFNNNEVNGNKDEVLVNTIEENTANLSTIQENAITKTFNGGFVIAFILFFTIYFYGYMVSNSIAEEKASRIIEMLVLSAKSNEIVMGKVIAMGILGLIQALELLIVFGISNGLVLADIKRNFLNFEVFKNLNISLENFSFLNLHFGTPSGLLTYFIVFFVILSLILFFVCGYLVYAFICAIAGASVDKAEEVQMVNGPISILAMIGFYMSVLTSSMPDLEWVKIAKYLPFSSPFAMPVNIINGTTNIDEIFISLLILCLSTIWLGIISMKVYRHVILNYGNSTKFMDIIKIIFGMKEK